MNRILPLLPLISICCHAAPYTTASPTAALAEAEARYIALQTLQRVYAALYEHSSLPPVDKDAFLQAFAEQLRQPQKHIQEQISALYEGMEAFRLQQLQQADFRKAHAAQPGVTLLPNGLQYDVYTSTSEHENYYARRAHRIVAYIPGTDTELPLNSVPLCVEEALYSTPRGLVWRFILPANLLDATDAAAMTAEGIHTVEILATRPTTTAETYRLARASFADKKPHLPRILAESAEQHLQRSALWGRMVADTISAPVEAITPHMAPLLHLLQNPSEQNKAELEQGLADAEKAYFRALESLTEVRQTQIANDIMLAQREIPGTITLSNGILCRKLSTHSPAVDIRNGARFMEYEELGSATYYRVKQRIISTENDLPAPIMQVVREIPRAAAWELILPPQLLNDRHLLPIRYRIYSKRQQEQAPNLPLLPGTL